MQKLSSRGIVWNSLFDISRDRSHLQEGEKELQHQWGGCEVVEGSFCSFFGTFP